MPQPDADTVQPPRQLKGFDKLRLEAGQARQVRLAFDDRSFAYWDSAAQDWAVAPGCYRIEIGASSRDIRLQTRTARAGGSCN